MNYHARDVAPDFAYADPPDGREKSADFCWRSTQGEHYFIKESDGVRVCQICGDVDPKSRKQGGRRG